MHPRIFAQTHTDKPALIMAETGESLTYGELESLANRGAQMLRALGVQNGDIIALWARNSLEFMSFYWAAQRAGVYVCPLAVYLSVDDARFILDDCKAKLLVVSDEIRNAEDFTASGTPSSLEHIYCLGRGNLSDLQSWDDACATMPETPITDEEAGCHLIYSSGTTGRPKGVKLPLIGGPIMADNIWVKRYDEIYNLSDQTVCLSCAPLYHTAPILFASNVMRRGATVVIMKKFDEESALKAIDDYGVTLSFMVPTMFIRMLRLPDTVRLSYNISSLEHVVHAAAPCPLEIKYKMMDWFGDIIDEYYSGSESIGVTTITSPQWRLKPGSVGQGRNSSVHICNDDGDELPRGVIGNIYFKGGYDFEYLNDPVKSRAARNPKDMTMATLGDIGYLDEDAYLFLTDRKKFIIISGGVNIYPQETENLLIQHPKVSDVAVFGVPNPDMGEEVKAVIEPIDWTTASPELEAELIAFCRESLSPIKCPKSVDFEKSLPRQDNGKLYKRELRARYWPESNSEKLKT